MISSAYTKFAHSSSGNWALINEVFGTWLFKANHVRMQAYIIASAAMCGFAVNVYKLTRVTAIFGAVILLIFGCGESPENTHGAYYSVKFEVAARNELRTAGTAIKNTIEEECSLVGHERPIYRIIGGDEEFYFMFQSHTLTGDLRVGAIVYSSVGERIQVSVELFLSGFDDVEDLEFCQESVEKRIQKGFQDLIRQPN